MAICSHLASNGEKSILYQQLEQKYGPEKAHDIWTAVKSEQFKNKYHNVDIERDANNEPALHVAEEFAKQSNIDSWLGQVNVKPGVPELFESNPELANTVYEVLGFKSKPDVILPIGTSGSGKSTFIKSLPQENLVVIEPDAMRVEFTGNMNDKSKDKEIYEEAANRAIQAIKQGKQVVFDTTNLTKDKRSPFIEAIKKAIPNANIQYKLMELNPELAKQRIKAQLERGENRASVSDETIDRHAASYKQMLEDIKSEPINNFELTPQQKQQAQQLYSQYLDTIFPDSKVRDIVYRGGNITKEEFEQSDHTPTDYMDLGVGLYLTPNKKVADYYGPPRAVIVNIKTPKDVFVAQQERADFGRKEGEYGIPKLDSNGKYDGIVDLSQSFNKTYELVVFEPEQIHILGSKQDIQGFKDFVGVQADTGSNQNKQTSKETVPVSLGDKLPKHRLSSTEMLDKIKAIYKTAEENPDKTYAFKYEHKKDKSTVENTQYTSLELANLFDSVPIPDNIEFTESMSMLIQNSARRILRAFQSDFQPGFIEHNKDVVEALSEAMLVKKWNAKGERDGFFSPEQYKEIVDSLTAYTERLYRKDPALKENALLKIIGLIQSKEKQLVASGNLNTAAVYKSINEERVKIAESILYNLESMGLYTNDSTKRRILSAVESLTPLTEQEKTDFLNANPNINIEEVDQYDEGFMEAMGRIGKDWSENSFELNPRDTASARIKLFLGNMFKMDTGVYTVGKDGIDLSDMSLDNLEELPQKQLTDLARRVSRKSFWYKSQEQSETLKNKLNSVIPYFPMENFMGLEMIADGDELFSDVLSALGDNVNSLTTEEAIKILEDNSNPTIKQVAKELKQSDKSMKNEFMTVMSKQHQPFVMALFSVSVDENNKQEYNLTPIEANRYNQVTTIVSQWQEQQKLLPITVINEHGARVLNTDYIKKNWLPLIETANKVTDWNTPKARAWFVKHIGNMFREAGVGLTDEMMQDLFSNPGKWTESSSVEGLFYINKTNNQASGLISMFIRKAAGMQTNTTTDEAGSSLLVLNNPLYDTLIKSVAKLAVKYTPVYSFNHKNSEGKTIYDWGLNTKLSNEFRKLKTDFPTFIDTLSKTDISGNVWVLNTLLENQRQIEEIELAYLDGLKPKWKNKGTVREDMSDREQLLTALMLFQNSGHGYNKNMSRVTYMSLTHSDKTTTPVFRNMPKVNVGRAGFTPNTLVGNSDSVMFNVFKAEYDRIVNQEKIDFNNKQYNSGKSLFYFIPDFNLDGMKNLVEQGVITTNELHLIWPAGRLTRVIEEKELAVINKVLENLLNNLTNRTVIKWTNNGIINESYNMFDKMYVRRLMNVEGINKRVKENRRITDDKTEYVDQNNIVLSNDAVNARIAYLAAKDYAVNTFLFNVALSQMFYGDPAESYKKPHDRANELEIVEATMIEYAKRLAKDIAPKTDLYWDKDNQWYNTITLKDVMTKEHYLKDITELAAHYVIGKGINSTDAQELVTVQEKLDVLMAAGKIKSTVYNEMTAIIKKAGPGGYYEFKLPEHVAVIMQPDKPLYSGFREVENGARLSDYIKSSSWALYPPFLKGRPLDEVRKLMEKESIARANFESAKKIGLPSESLELISSDGTFVKPDKNLLQKSIQKLNRSGFGIQQEVPYDEEKEAIKIVTQMNEGITSNIGHIDNFFLPGIETPLSGNQLKVYKEDIRKQMLRLNLESLNKKLNLDSIGTIDREVLTSILADEARKKGYTYNELQSVLLKYEDGTQIISNVFNTAADKFESLLMSIVNKVAEIKMPGKSYVQASSAGLRVLDASLAYGVVWVGDYDGSPLKGMRIENGVVKPGQIIVPFNFFDSEGNKLKLEDFVTEVDGKKILDPARIPPELLQLVGARIPNQNYSSMHPLEIVGFVPDNMGDVAFIPAALVKQMGGDFDVDKLYTYKRPYTYKDGSFSVNDGTKEYLGANQEEWEMLKAKTIEKAKQAGEKANNKGLYSRSVFNKYLAETVHETYGEANVPKHKVMSQVVTMEKLQSEYFNIHWAVLTHKDMLTTILKPLDKDDIKNESALLKTSGGSYYNFYDPISQLDDFQSGKQAKRLVGATSWAVKMNSRLQGKNMRLGKRIVITHPDGYKELKVVRDEILVIDEHSGEKKSLSLLSGTGKSRYSKKDGDENNSELRTKGDTHVMVQSESVDNAKSRTLDNLNLTVETYKAVQALIELQTDDDWAPNSKYWTRLITQPALWEYSNLMKQGNDSMSDKYEADLHGSVIAQLISKYTEGLTEEDVDSVKDIAFSPQLLLKAQSMTGTEFNKHQIAALLLFSKLYSVGNRLFQLESVFTQDVSGAGPRLASVFTKYEMLPVEQEEDMNSVPIMNEYNLYKDPSGNSTEAGETFDILNSTALDVVGQVFPYHALKPVFNQLSVLIGGKQLSEDLIKNVIRSYRSYVYTKGTYLWADPQNERARLIYGNNSLARRVYRAKQTWGKSNLFLNNLYEKIGDTEFNPDFIEYRAGVNVPVTEKQNITNSWLHMLLSNEEEERKLGEDLLRYSLLTGGIQDATSFVQFVPVTYIAGTEFNTMLRAAERNMQEEKNLDEAGFLIQFIQHNPNILTTVSKKQFGITSSVREYPESFEVKTDSMYGFAAPLPFVSYYSRADNKWILYAANEINESVYYTRIDTLGDKFTDEYDGKTGNAHRSLLQNNRALSERMPGFIGKSLETEKNNSFMYAGYANNPYYFEQIGVKEGGEEELNEILLGVAQNKTIPEYLRIVAEALSTSQESKAAQKAKELSHAANKPLRIQWDENMGQGAAQSDFNNRLLFSPTGARNKTEAARVLLHEILHNKLQWLVLAAGYDKRFNDLPIVKKQIEEFRKNNSEIVRHLEALDKLRYQALQKFKNGISAEEYEILIRDVENGRIKSDNHLLYYALHSLQEFVAHVPTDKNIGMWLNMLKAEDTRSLLEKVWDLFARLLEAFSRAMGYKVKDGSVLKESLVHIFSLTNTETRENRDITGTLLDTTIPLVTSTEQEATNLSELLNGTYDRDVTMKQDGTVWNVIVNEYKQKKRHSIEGQRGRILDELYEQADSISDAVRRTHDLKIKTGLRAKYNEVRDSIKLIHQNADIEKIAIVGQRQLKWIDSVLNMSNPSTLDINLAINTARLWESLIDILYGPLKEVSEIGASFVAVQTEAQKKRIMLINDKARVALTRAVDKYAKLTPMDFGEKITDLDIITANTMSLTRAKSLLVNSVTALAWRDANNRDEEIYRNSLKLKALEKKMEEAGLKPEDMLQINEDGTSWGLVNRLSNLWSVQTVEERQKLEAAINSLDKIQNADEKARLQKKHELWNEYWKTAKDETVFVDVREFFDMNTGKALSNTEAAMEKLGNAVGDAEYAKELVKEAGIRYLDYLSEREARIDYIRDSIMLTREEEANKTEAEKKELLNSMQTKAIEAWLRFNSPVAFMERVTTGKNIEFGSEADAWIIKAPKKEFSKYYDDNYKKISENETKLAVYNQYKAILAEMKSYLPMEIQKNLPDNFFPIVPKDTAGWLSSVMSKIKNWDTELLNAIAATDMEAALRDRPDKIPVIYTKPTSLTKDIGNRSTDMIRVLELFSMMALQHKHMGSVLDTINVAEGVLKEIDRQRLNNKMPGKTLRNTIDALKYFKDMLVFKKPKELQGKIDSPVYSLNLVKQHKIINEINELVKEQTELNNRISEKMIEGDFNSDKEDERLEQIRKKLVEYEFEARNIYGSKFADMLISVNQMKGIGYNPFSALSNYTFAEISLFIHGRGRVDYTPEGLRRATMEMTHSAKKYWTFGSVTDTTSNKIHGLMARTGIMGDVVDTDYGAGPNKKKTRTSRVFDMYNWQRSGDYFTKGKLMIAMMLKEEIEVTEQSTGIIKKIPLYEAFNSDGEWDVEKYGENADWDTRNGGEKFILMRDRMRKVSMMVFGNQDKNSPLMARKNWLWSLAGQFRLSWFPEGIATRFKAEYDDPNLQRAVKGRWRSYIDVGLLTSSMITARQLLAALPGVKIDVFNGLTNRKGTLLSESPVDMENMRKNFSELAWVAMFTASIIILRSMAGGDEDKDKHKRKLLINMLIRNQQDLLLYASPAVFNTISGNFLPATQVIVDYWNAMTASAHYIFGDTSKERHAFDTWLKKMTRAGIPHPSATLYNKFETMMTRDLSKINR